MKSHNSPRSPPQRPPQPYSKSNKGSKALAPIREAPPPPTHQHANQHHNQHSHSSSMANQPDAFKSAPTLGTITASPTVESPHVSPFPTTSSTTSSMTPGSSALPSYGPGPRPFTSSSTINTATTPLTTTPSGSSVPIKLTMSGLNAAIAAGGSLSAVPPGQQAISRPALSVPVSSQQPSNVSSAQSSSPLTNISTAPTSIKSPGLGTSSQNIVVTDSQQPDLQSQQQQESVPGKVVSPTENKSAIGARKNAPTTTVVRTRGEGSSWTYYLFLGIFLFVLLILIIALVITKSRKT